MRFRPYLWILGAAVLTAAQPSLPVGELVALVRSAVEEKQTDSALAKSLHKLKLSEALDEHSVEELQSLGVGPKALAELERLQESSESLPKPLAAPAFPSPPPPSAAEAAEVINQAREIALGYTHSLPDFVASELVHRYANDKGGWQLRDTLVIRLNYFEQQEKYNVLSINGRPSTLPYEAVGGTITQGEFGSLLREVFERRSAAELHWDHWTNLRGRLAHVYSFRVRVANSRYTMVFGTRGEQFSITAGQHGFVYVDRETNQIVRITTEADSIPADFPVKSSSTWLDYGFTDVGGRKFLLPLRAVVRMGTRGGETRNEVEFQSYKKYGAETSITFEGAVPEKDKK